MAPSRYERFKRFHRDNPHVFKLFKRFAVDALETGRRRRFGARMIGERLRWYTAIEVETDDFKLNDHYWPYYARLLVLTDKRFDTFFELRGGGGDVSDIDLYRECK